MQLPCPDPLVYRQPPLRPVAHIVGDARIPAPVAVGGPPLGQVQVGVQEGPEPPPDDPDVDGHDPAVDLADAPQVLALPPGRVAAPLAAARLVDPPDRPERVGRE